MRLLLAVWMLVLLVAPDGSTLHIKGISLGNWLMPEGYMFKFEVAKAPRQIYGAFERGGCHTLDGTPSPSPEPLRSWTG